MNSAAFSADEFRIYRYDLTRQWGPGTQHVWVMLNPSTADETLDDPTIRRCINFSKLWGAGRLVVVNLYAMRATRPAKLLDVDDPEGPENARYVRQHITAHQTTMVIAAWGAYVDKLTVVNAGRVFIELTAHVAQKPVRCLGRTRSGAPRHPLYVRADTKPEPFGAFS